MTRFSDNIYTGMQAQTSALSSKSGALYRRRHRFTAGAGGTQTGTFPMGTENLDCKVWINQQSVSAATATRLTVSAGGVNLITIAGLGSALGVLRNTQAGLGAITNIASATQVLTGAAAAELTYSVTMVAASGDTTGDYTLELQFGRNNTSTLGVTA